MEWNHDNHKREKTKEVITVAKLILLCTSRSNIRRKLTHWCNKANPKIKRGSYTISCSYSSSHSQWRSHNSRSRVKSHLGWQFCCTTSWNWWKPDRNHWKLLHTGTSKAPGSILMGRNVNSASSIALTNKFFATFLVALCQMFTTALLEIATRPFSPATPKPTLFPGSSPFLLGSLKKVYIDRLLALDLGDTWSQVINSSYYWARMKIPEWNNVKLRIKSYKMYNIV